MRLDNLLKVKHHTNTISFSLSLIRNQQSDDPPVLRRRYASMIHDGGDVIRPGDCVLLRAGSKKNELPYVAKVASLWENPEDGK